MEETLAGRNEDIFTQIKVLGKIVNANRALKKVFVKASILNLGHYYVGGACIAQTVWNYQLGNPLNHAIEYFDFIYFDEDMNEEKEEFVVERVREFYKDIPVPIHVRNQARLHAGEESPAQPYASLEEALNSRPITAMALGARLERDQHWRIYAPYGLNDLFSMTLRPNKLYGQKKLYEKRVETMKKSWPELKSIPW